MAWANWACVAEEWQRGVRRPQQARTDRAGCGGGGTDLRPLLGQAGLDDLLLHVVADALVLEVLVVLIQHLGVEMRLVLLVGPRPEL